MSGHLSKRELCSSTLGHVTAGDSPATGVNPGLLTGFKFRGPRFPRTWEPKTRYTIRWEPLCAQKLQMDRIQDVLIMT